jgi:diguanylate cyclase (GGDEF)-like protein
MTSSLGDLRSDTQLMALSAAAMYGAATLDGAIEGLLPGDPPFALVPVLVVAAVFALLVLVGGRLPRWALSLLGPLGAALAAVAVATTHGPGDVAVLYTLPVLWTTFFFGRRGAVAIVACVAALHALSLLALPADQSNPARWVDVMVVVCVVALVVLVLEQRNAALLARLAQESRTDALTGLLNRRGFEERATLALAHTERTHTSLAVVTFDVDYFKRVNDEWGHDVGDRVLARIGTVIAAHTRVTDVAARMGGEEFTVLLAGSDVVEARELSARIRAALAVPDASDTPPVRMSAGVAACDAPVDIETCLQQADSALYEAKRSGRDRVVTYEAARPQRRPEAELRDRPASRLTPLS